MRTAHYAAFEAAVKAAVPPLSSLVFDGDVPLNADGTIRRATYVVLHDMGFDSQDDGRLAEDPDDVADGTYRVVARVVCAPSASGVGVARTGVRDVADTLTSGLVRTILTVPGRVCGAIRKDDGPTGIDRDESVSPPVFYLDVDFIWRSQRA